MSGETHLEESDITFMARAIQLAKKGQYTTHPNPRVGCVIVKDGKIIGEGYHQKTGQPHAEINALRDVKNGDTKGATAYVTLEPCSHTGKTPPCANALLEAQISRVIIAMQDPNPQVAGQGVQRLLDAGITVEVGILEEQTRTLNGGFIKRMEQGLPWVRIKLAMSLDGRTAMASGESQWITGAEARQDVQRLRAKADSILTGSGTILHDNPSLNVRISANELGISGEVQQPLKVILDSQLKTPLDARLLSLENTTLIFTQSHDEKLKDAFHAMGAEVIQIEKGKGQKQGLPLKQILQQLAKREINEIHVEAGATLCGALLQENLADEIIIYMAPTIMGSDARGLFNLPELDQIKDKIDLKIKDIRAVGGDWRITIIPVTK